MPDGSGLTGRAEADSAALIRVHVHLGEDPALADLADACDGDRYHLEVEQPVLDVPGIVRVVARITGTPKLTAAEKDLLRAVGKLKIETQCREYLTCAA